MTSHKSHEIVLLGGNFGGVSAAHYLLRHTIPSLQQLDKSTALHITLVTPNTRAYFKIASPRSAIQPKLLAESELWRPLSEAFKQYPADQIKVVQATAVALDPSKRTVTVEPTSAGETEQTILYDSLVISTGTTSPSPLWTLHRDENRTSEAFKSVQASLSTAKTVLIAGGGPVGVETAGEIASSHPEAKITLLSGGHRLLQRVKPATGAKAQAQLEQNFGVTVIHDVRAEPNVVSSPNSDEEAGKTTIPLSDGSTHTTDLFIDATGGAPNSEFLPQEWLDETKRVITRDAYFRVRGSGGDGDANADGVYVLGDIVAGSANTAMELDAMVPVVCSSIGVDIAAQHGQAAEGTQAPKPGFLGTLLSFLPGAGSNTLSQKEFKPMKDTIMVPIGPDGGVGQLFGWQVPGWFVKMAKGKSFLIQMMGPMISGDKWKA
ncbi:hypothetical protein Daus18300_009301 [Diaporthe australafricana]|uniref:FAD/NAD(P)-binding domain-containing protein n=1 Tax=Diaporthe australafricana TaxID=127596 RepID=A0ABR3WER4_9PEZI